MKKQKPIIRSDMKKQKPIIRIEESVCNHEDFQQVIYAQKKCKGCGLVIIVPIKIKEGIIE